MFDINNLPQGVVVVGDFDNGQLVTNKIYNQIQEAIDDAPVPATVFVLGERRAYVKKTGVKIFFWDDFNAGVTVFHARYHAQGASVFTLEATIYDPLGLVPNLVLAKDPGDGVYSITCGAADRTKFNTYFGGVTISSISSAQVWTQASTGFIDATIPLYASSVTHTGSPVNFAILIEAFGLNSPLVTLVDALVGGAPTENDVVVSGNLLAVDDLVIVQSTGQMLRVTAIDVPNVEINVAAISGNITAAIAGTVLAKVYPALILPKDIVADTVFDVEFKMFL